MEYRAFYCPGCATRIDTEIALRGDARVHDVIADV
jgi:acetone carboxylase gamma subunit